MQISEGKVRNGKHKGFLQREGGKNDRGREAFVPCASCWLPRKYSFCLNSDLFNLLINVPGRKTRQGKANVTLEDARGRGQCWKVEQKN